MSKIQDIASKYDVLSVDGFRQASVEMKSVSEGELRFTVAYDPDGQSRKWKLQHALAQSELERRAFAEQKKLTALSGVFGLLGVVVGATLQAMLSG